MGSIPSELGYNTNKMFTFLVVLTSLLFVLLVVFTSMRPAPNVVSTFELERRAKRQSKEAKAALRRERYLPDVLALQRIVTTLLLVIVVLLSVVTFGWLIGVIVALVVALEYGAIAKFPPLGKLSGKLYMRMEPALLRFAEKFNGIFVFIRSVPLHSVDAYHRFDSREELEQLISQSGEVLTVNERSLIVHALQFGDKRVDAVMTPRGMIDSIKKTEFLGPLVLSELHDTGHSRLPVIGQDLDHIVGVLHLKDMLSLDVKRSVTAEKAMEAKVYYIREDDTLEHALAAFLKTQHHLFIVINAQRETVGIVTIEDVLEALIGRKILDEDDNHESAHEIAGRKAEPNNSPENHTDV